MYAHRRRVLKCTFLVASLLSINVICAKAIVSQRDFLESTTDSRGFHTYTFEVVHKWPHDTTAFTEGLVFNNGALYESTGLKGLSSLRKVDWRSGKIVKIVNIPDHCYAEGITILNGKVFQLTWLNQKGFIYDQNTFRLLGEFNYDGQGWGLTNDGNSLIMSDGTNILRFLDPETFRVTKTVGVYDQNIPLTNLNELEYIKGEIYANIWHSYKIARIDPNSGKIRGWIDLSGLRPAESRKNQEAVLNGIAYDKAHDRIFVTGKFWPVLFEIRVKENENR